MFTNRDIMQTAVNQSAEDIGCSTDDLLNAENRIVPLRPGKNAKNYYRPPISCNFISYGNNIVAAANEELYDIVSEYINKFKFYHCLEMPNMLWLNERLAEKKQSVCFMAEYFLPDMNRLKELPCPYEIRILEKPDLEELYQPEWSNAIDKGRKEFDMLGVGAYDGAKLVGLAGCSADAAQMWQIGIDVLPEYRRKGIASALTSKIAVEIIKRGKVPFYCSAWSNIRSVGNAIKSGFTPSWIEMTVKPVEIVRKINSEQEL